MARNKSLIVYNATFYTPVVTMSLPHKYFTIAKKVEGCVFVGKYFRAQICFFCHEMIVHYKK